MSQSRILRHSADRRTLLYGLGFFPLPLCVALFRPTLVPWLLPLTLYLSFCAGVLAHYHNHLGVFKKAIHNRVYAAWLSMFYGFPLVAWIPTHNQNHHRYQNGPGDDTRTQRLGGGDSLLEMLSYPSRSSARQLLSIGRYLQRTRRQNPRALRWIGAQAAAVVLFQLGAASLLLTRHGLRVGLLAYALAVALPALLAPWLMMIVNYLQHAGCDHRSPHNHSRNFVGAWENWLVFDAGLHTVHHEHPGTHWSRYHVLHAERAHLVAPHLRQRNMLTFVFARYVLGRGDPAVSAAESGAWSPPRPRAVRAPGG